MRRAFLLPVRIRRALNFTLFVGARADEPRRPIEDASPSTVRGVSGHWMIRFTQWHSVPLYSKSARTTSLRGTRY